ncbi:MAG: DHA2 family efflux MFS transporter permease subunit [Xanthobacteraceae bacterium]
MLHADRDRIDPRRLVAFLAMCVGMFMAFLDIQIVSASLSEIQAGLSASADEINWVQTSYLIAEVVSIPLSGYLSRALGTRMMFTISAGGFTFASLMCGFTSSMNEMIFWRAIQGFIGGGMIPTVFASTYLIFPRSKMPVIIPLIGLIATLAPTIGPTIGGFLTEALSWHWLFFINIIPGIVVSLAAYSLIDFDRPDYSLFDNFDWTGLITMAMFLGALEYVLEEGPRNDWFEDGTIVTFAIVSAVGAIGFFWRALTTRNPIVDLLAFANRNFALGSMFSFVLGVGLYGLTYLYPLYLARVRGYDALMIGETMFVSGAAMFLSAPLVGRLMTKIDLRLMLLFGFVTFAAGSWMMTYVTKDFDYWELFVPQVLRGIGLMFSMVPVTNLALGTLPPERLKNASGLFNLMRNLGGAVGLALLNTLLNDRMDLHFARLHDSVNWANPPAQEMLENLTTRFSSFGTDAPEMALRQMMQITRMQGTVMAFGDVFLVVAGLFVTFGIMVLVLRRPPVEMQGGTGH